MRYPTRVLWALMVMFVVPLLSFIGAVAGFISVVICQEDRFNSYCQRLKEGKR